MRLATLSLAIASLLSGCISYIDKPTVAMVDQQLGKTRKLVTFLSDRSPLELADLASAKKCGEESTTLTTLQPTGAGFVSLTSTYDYTVERGLWPNGSMWVALRTDGRFHGTPMGYRLKAGREGTEVTVYAADKRKIAEIKDRVEAGTLFCQWRKYSYPYD